MQRSIYVAIRAAHNIIIVMSIVLMHVHVIYAKVGNIKAHN